MQLVRTPLWQHQLEDVAKLRTRPRVLIANAMGTGKSLLAVERDLWLRRDVYRGATLVVAPLSTHSTWRETYERETALKVKCIDRKDRDSFLEYNIKGTCPCHPAKYVEKSSPSNAVGYAGLAIETNGGKIQKSGPETKGQLLTVSLNDTTESQSSSTNRLLSKQMEYASSVGNAKNYLSTIVMKQTESGVSFAETVMLQLSELTNIQDGYKDVRCICPNDVMIMHYEALRLMPELKKFKFGHVIFDECHRLKNRTTKQTKAAKKLKIPYITAMSGSPVTDHPQDIWQILNILYPKQYSSFWNFFEKYIDYKLKTVKRKSPDGKVRLVNYKEVVGPAETWSATGLAQIRSFYVRRRQEECIDIPGKLYNKIEVDLSHTQRRIYNEMADDMLTWIKNSFGEDEALPAPAVIAKLQRLQLIALGTPEFGTPVTKKNGDVITPIKLVDPSTKVDAVMEMLEDHDTEQFVVFSQFKGPLRLLRGRFESNDITYGSFTGDDNQRLRDVVKRQFIEGSRRILLGTIATGGVGVDGLQHATANVIFLDRDWSPALNDQAEDRLNRAGQTKHVNVYDIMAKDTIDFDRSQTITMKAGWVRRMLGDE